MNKSRLEWKVGLFVFIGLVLLAVLLLQFSKGASLFRPTYTSVPAPPETSAASKPRASVLMSGVQVGTVSDIQLSPSGTNVTITLRIYKQYHDPQGRPVRHRTIRFSRRPIRRHHARRTTRGRISAPGATRTAEEPFNLQEVARSAAGFIQRIDETATKLNDAISDVRRLVLNEQTLTNLAATVGNMRGASERALSTVTNSNALVATNGPPISLSASNLLLFSEQI